MRKTFKLFCAAALAVLAVSSCGKIWDEFDAVHGEIDSLKERVAKLETDLNAQVEALNGKITALDAAYKAADADLLKKLTDGDAALATSLSTLTAQLDALDGKVDGYITSNDAALKAAIDEYKKGDKALADKDSEILAALVGVGVTKVEKNEAGNAVLTFTDGSKLEVPAQPETGLVTVVEEDEVKYWAVIVDGEPESLGVPVGHVELEFKVDAETLALMYSVDGGTTWVATGAYVADSEESLLTDFYQGETDEMDWDTYEFIKEDFFTLVFGGETYQLPLYKVDNAVVTIKSGKTYFQYGDVKTFDVVVADVKNMYVMTKPDGWRANLEGNKLTVTAPSEANVTAGLAEADGEVLLHCSTNEGNCRVARLAVATTPGFSLKVTEDGKVTITNPEVTTYTDPWTGEKTTDFNDAYLGLAPVKEFLADPQAYVENAMNNYDDIVFMLGAWKSNTAETEYDEETEETTVTYTVGGKYVEGTYEIDVIESTVADMYKYMTYSEIPVGSRYIVWASPVDENGLPRTDETVYSYYSVPVDVEIKAVEDGVTTSDVEVTVSVEGAETYYVGLVTEEMLYGFPIDEYMQNQEGPFGYLQMALQYGMPEYAFQMMGVEFGGEFGMEMPETLLASEIMGGSLMPDSKFYMWVFPVIEGLDLADYTYEDNLKPYIYEFKTNPLVAGGSATVEFGEEEMGFTSMAVEVLASEGATMVYYNWYDVDTFNEITDLEAELIKEGYVEVGDIAVARNQAEEINPGESYVLAALAVDAEGKYGEAVSDTFESRELVYSETFTAAFGEPTSTVFYSGYRYDFPVTVTGGTAAKYYYVFSEEEYTEEELANLPLVYDYDYNFRQDTDLKDLYAPAGTTYYLAVVVESEDGELSPVITKTIEVPALPAEE